MADKMNCEISKVEKDPQSIREYPKLLVTAKSLWGTTVIFEVPSHRAKAYTIGRTVEVSVKLAQS